MMFRNRKAAVLIIACLFSLFCLLPVRAEIPVKKYTVMVYMCGSSLESENSQATMDISNMLGTRFNLDDVNVVLLLGGCTRWAGGYSSKQLTLLELSGRRPAVVGELPLAPMSESKTLTSFLETCWEQYPAENYILDIWNHGGGPIYGVCQDLLFGGDMLTLQELTEALEKSPFGRRKLDAILMDACLMGSAEVSVALAPYAKYLVAGEDGIYGMKYDFLAGIAQESAFTSVLARAVDDAYALNKEAIEYRKANNINSFALVDLEKVPALIPAMEAFFEEVTPSVSAGNFTAMSARVRNATAFGVGDDCGTNGSDLVDLGDLVQRYRDYAPEQAEVLGQAISDAVIYRRSALESCSGLTVYHPYANKKAIRERMEVYATLDFSPSYLRYLEKFIAILAGDTLADWSGLEECEQKVDDRAMRMLFMLTLKEDQAAHYGDSRFEVLHRLEDGSLQFTYVSGDTSFDREKGEITGEFTGTALYAVSAEGDRLSGELEYSVTDGGVWQIPAVLTIRGTDGAEDVKHRALISCAPDPKTETLTPGGVQVWEETFGGYTIARGASFTDYQEITLTAVSRQETRNGEGILLPFAEWSIAGTQDWSFAIDGSWSFALMHDTLNTDDLYATFQVSDSQNNVYSSELRPVNAVPPEEEIHITYDDAFLRINGFSLETTRNSIVMSLGLSNRTEKEAFIRLRSLVVDGIALDVTAEAVGTGENWGIKPGEAEEQIMTVSLDPSRLESRNAITEIRFDLVLVDAGSEEELQTVPVLVTLNRNLSSLR